MNTPYDDMLHLPHHISKTRNPMSMEDRAAQFSPFAALNGYDAAIRETGRLTDSRIDMDEDALIALDLQYQRLLEQIGSQKEVRVTYFHPDSRKAGGAYVTTAGIVKKIDTVERILHLKSGITIPLDHISDISFEADPPLNSD